jgi:hypothetical protein
VFRNFAIAAILVLAASSAQAEDSLSTRIHDAAVKACAAKIGDNLPISYYRAFSAHCVDRVTTMTMSSIAAKQVARNDTAAN